MDSKAIQFSVLVVSGEGIVPFRCGRPLSCGVDGEPLRLRLQGLTCPLFPRESADLRYTALCAFGGEIAYACAEIQSLPF
ncbi:hypothetical protein ANABIO32_34750 [Rossellomorea marisflavi]|uniref:hypothetical protein n=1 Tax=Rossellomorea marisflavi TaxID=189381 RepID=UPI0025CAF05A|nr:hypothetical protein [Rossellomorea marisflavi]GLI85726.1 hypothetical protein ANABIO32_34750 [Rossellomorea marisflavi]